MMEELDLKVLKGIITDKVNALTFAYRYDSSLFDEDSELFAKLVIDYIKHFRAPPTKRTLLDRHKNNSNLTELIESAWDEVEVVESNIYEFQYDLGELKKRYQQRAVDIIRERATLEDPDNPENPEEYFNKLSLEISRVTSLDMERTHTQKPVGDYITEFQEGYEARKQCPEDSPEIKTNYSMIDSVAGGVSPGELIMIGGETNSGKATYIHTPILTLNGWSTMGEIKVGDFVYDENGEPTKVIAATEVMYDHECYELTFSCGEKIIADANHMWETLDFRARRSLLKNTDAYRAKRRLTRESKSNGSRPWVAEMNSARQYNVKGPLQAQIRSTKEISETLRVFSKKDQPYNHTIKPTKPLNFSEKDLIIDPYVLGAWLGDGTSSGGSFASDDIQIVNEIRKFYEVNKLQAKYVYGILKLSTDLKKYHLINNKHIPIDYIQGSVQQRLALIQGLMDTDGTVTKFGACDFCTVKENLKDQVCEVLCSLGIIPRVYKGVAKYNGKITGDKYIISFRTSLPVFRLDRKLQKQKRENFKYNYRTIVDAQKIDSVPVKCIQVESNSNMFLCGKRLIPTHNSMLLNNMAKQIWMGENTLDTAVQNFQRGYNILYFSLEMPYQDCFIRFLASLANVPQRSLQKSTLTREEDERVKQAYEFIKRYQEAGYYFDIVDVPRNLTIEEVELRYQDALLRYRPEVVIVDYMGLMNSKALAKEQDWLKLGGIASSLHEFARAYDCVVITAAQLTDLKRNSGSQGSQEDSRRVGVHRWGRSSLIMHNVNLGIQIETRTNETSFPDLKIHVVKNRKGPLGQGNLVKNFANASLVDVPFDQNEMPGDVSANIPNLIKAIQDAKNAKDNNSK